MAMFSNNIGGVTRTGDHATPDPCLDQFLRIPFREPCDFFVRSGADGLYDLAACPHMVCSTGRAGCTRSQTLRFLLRPPFIISLRLFFLTALVCFLAVSLRRIRTSRVLIRLVSAGVRMRTGYSQRSRNVGGEKPCILCSSAGAR